MYYNGQAICGAYVRVTTKQPLVVLYVNKPQMRDYWPEGTSVAHSCIIKDIQTGFEALGKIHPSKLAKIVAVHCPGWSLKVRQRGCMADACAAQLSEAQLADTQRSDLYFELQYRGKPYQKCGRSVRDYLQHYEHEYSEGILRHA